jgi:hypothetical protein
MSQAKEKASGTKEAGMGHFLTTVATASPWEPYETQGKGKGKDKPIIPESNFYGFTFISLLLLVVLARLDNRNKKD